MAEQNQLQNEEGKSRMTGDCLTNQDWNREQFDSEKQHSRIVFMQIIRCSCSPNTLILLGKLF